MRVLSSLLFCGAVLVGAPAFAFELSLSEGSVVLEETPSNIVAYDLAVIDSWHTLGIAGSGVVEETTSNIVAYGLVVIDSLHTLGIAVSGVPQSAELYTGSLQEIKQGTYAGTLFAPDYEVLRALQPDLIFAGGRSQGEID